MALRHLPFRANSSASGSSYATSRNSNSNSNPSSRRISHQQKNSRLHSRQANVFYTLRLTLVILAVISFAGCLVQESSRSTYFLLIHNVQTSLDYGPAVTSNNDPRVLGSFDANLFHKNLHQYRKQTKRVQDYTKDVFADQSSDETLYIPFWDDPLLFKKRHSWHLMVMVFAEDCLPNYQDSSRRFPNLEQNFPILATLQDVLQTQFADIVVYLPQIPQSTLFSNSTQPARHQQLICQQNLVAKVQSQFYKAIQSGQLQIVNGVVNPLPPRIQYHYNHQYFPSYNELLKMNLLQAELPNATKAMQQTLESQQLQMELEYSLGLDFTYAAELAYQYADLLFFVRSGTRLKEEYAQGNTFDYGYKIVQHHEQFRTRLDEDQTVHPYCYQSFLQNDMMSHLPFDGSTQKRETIVKVWALLFQPNQHLPTGILMERQGLYRMSLALRSMLPYHNKATTAGLLQSYCTDLLWQSQILYPVRDESGPKYPPALFQVPNKSNRDNAEAEQHKHGTPLSESVAEQQAIDLHRAASPRGTIPAWVTLDTTQLVLGENSLSFPFATSVNSSSSSSSSLNSKNVANTVEHSQQQLVTFVIPTATRPNGIQDQYVISSINQLLPLLKRDFYNPATKHYTAHILLVVCGNTQEDLDRHYNVLRDKYVSEIQNGTLEIVRTNLDTYPSLYNLPNTYKDHELRVRWRSKQNLDISAAFFAAKGRALYTLLLEDDTAAGDSFTSKVKSFIESDILVKSTEKVVKKYENDYTPHVFSYMNFGFGYSGVLVPDEYTSLYAILHYIFMFEKPCDLLHFGKHLQGKYQERGSKQMTKLLTHMGTISSLEGKIHTEKPVQTGSRMSGLDKKKLELHRNGVKQLIGKLARRNG